MENSTLSAVFQITVKGGGGWGGGVIPPSRGNTSWNTSSFVLSVFLLFLWVMLKSKFEYGLQPTE